MSSTGTCARRCVLHVGMPKCGSSALQTALSAHPELRGAGASRACYVALHPRGELLAGEALRARAGDSALGYVVSARDEQLAALGTLALRGLAGALREVADDALLLLSNEGWGNHHAVFREGRLLERLGLEAEVVFYVRPQVGCCNSAWWQWGAWSGKPLPAWIDRHLPRMQWHAVAAAWREVPGVTRVRPRLLPEAGIVQDFCGLFGLEPPPDLRANASLPAPVLRLLQRHRALRPGPHDAAVEFALSRHLALEGSPPWVLPPAQVERILDQCRAGNEALAAMLDAPDAQRMRDDPAWWSAAHWAGRQAEPWKPRPPDADESDALAAAAIAAIERLDAENRALRARLREGATGGTRGSALLQRLRKGFRGG